MNTYRLVIVMDAVDEDDFIDALHEMKRFQRAYRTDISKVKNDQKTNTKET